jgi:hypothetical protein
VLSNLHHLLFSWSGDIVDRTLTLGLWASLLLMIYAIGTDFGWSPWTIPIGTLLYVVVLALSLRVIYLLGWFTEQSTDDEPTDPVKKFADHIVSGFDVSGHLKIIFEMIAEELLENAATLPTYDPNIVGPKIQVSFKRFLSQLVGKNWTIINQERIFLARARDAMANPYPSSVFWPLEKRFGEPVVFPIFERDEFWYEYWRKHPPPWTTDQEIQRYFSGTALAVLDGHPFKLKGPSGVLSFLFEADRDTEGNRNLTDVQRPYIEAKFRNYISFTRTEGYQKHFGFPNLIVLFVTTSSIKCANFQKLLLNITDGKGVSNILFKPFPDFLTVDGSMEPDTSFLADPWPRAGYEPFDIVERLGGESRLAKGGLCA